MWSKIQLEFQSIVAYLSGVMKSPKDLLILCLVIDVILVGKLGVVAYSTGVMKDVITHGLAGGTSLIVLLLVAALIFKK